MSFYSLTDGAASNTLTTTRLKRQLTEQAIAAATAADWSEAVRQNERILELGPDSEAENRLAKAFWELGELANAREHYQAALAIDPTNRIADRNISRLRILLAEAGKKTVPAKPGSKAPVSIFVEASPDAGVRVRVSNPLRDASTVAAHGASAGVVGMRERVETLGGEAWIGAHEREFIVDVSFPWLEVEPA